MGIIQVLCLIFLESQESILTETVTFLSPLNLLKVMLLIAQAWESSPLPCLFIFNSLFPP